MQQVITLTNQEVNEAIVQYTTRQGINFDGMSIEVNLIAGRKENGVYATIELKPVVGESIQDSITEAFNASILPTVLPKDFEPIKVFIPDISNQGDLSALNEVNTSSFVDELEPDDNDEIFS